MTKESRSGREVFPRHRNTVTLLDQPALDPLPKRWRVHLEFIFLRCTMKDNVPAIGITVRRKTARRQRLINQAIDKKRGEI